MFDFHCHILPGIDDGAKSWEESLEMAKIAVEGGVKTIVATPHYSTALAPATILELVQKFNGYLQEEGLPLTIVPGTEAPLEPELPSLLQSGQVLCIHGKYVLVELPFHNLPIYTEEVLFQLALAGYQVILAHPERNLQVAANPGLVFAWVKQGVLVQINTGSILGKFGSNVRQSAEVLVKAKLVHFVGTDAHSSGGRRPDLAEAYPVLRELTTRARDICQVNGHLLLLDQFVAPEDFSVPQDQKRPWWRRMLSNER